MRLSTEGNPLPHNATAAGGEAAPDQHPSDADPRARPGAPNARTERHEMSAQARHIGARARPRPIAGSERVEACSSAVVMCAEDARELTP